MFPRMLITCTYFICDVEDNIKFLFSSTILHQAGDTNSLLAANGHPARESDLSYSQFSVSQSMPTRYANSVSSINDPTISIAEVRH